MHRDFIEKLEANPVIAAVKDDQGLEKAIQTECEIIFILYGDICTISQIVDKVKSAGKLAMVHLDLITGLNNTKEISVEFIKNNTNADGIITTKGNLIGRAKELGLYTVLRYFVIDSMALVNIVLPKIIKRVNATSKVPVLAGGLIGDRDDVMNALNNGVLAVSTTNEAVWKL